MLYIDDWAVESSEVVISGVSCNKFKESTAHYGWEFFPIWFPNSLFFDKRAKRAVHQHGENSTRGIKALASLFRRIQQLSSRKVNPGMVCAYFMFGCDIVQLL